MTALLDQFPLILGWLGYFALHSCLAGMKTKQRLARTFPRAARYYRLGYNLLAAALLLPLLGWIYARPGPDVWVWAGWQAWLANGLALAALIGFATTSTGYDLADFLGLRQARGEAPPTADSEGLKISTWHRHVRHPWYFLALVLIWTRDMSTAFLISAVLMTLYFWVGSRLEEAKLIAYYGDAYRRYRERVPGLVPLPWRRLSREEADAILRESRNL
jgi:protein-S-isoprenylcysteine O-methyltransferase Ste14